MKRFFLTWILIGLCTHSYAQSGIGPHPEAYEGAVQLIHAYSGSGDELQRAMTVAKELFVSHPNGGYAETLQAEALSTWELDQQGRPPALFSYLMKLTDDAIRLNPDLAQAYVARARALVRASEYDKANAAIDSALKLAPNFNGALFLRAEVFRRTQRVSEAETWYLKFIDATPDRPRKSNGYYWLGKAYQDAATQQPEQRPAYISKAKSAYERMVEHDPNAAWKTVNFAIFLNSDAGDFVAAELYAQKALSIMDFPMARYHLAIARYQQLLAPMQTMDDKALRLELFKVSESTGILFVTALDFSQRYPPIAERLKVIQARMTPVSMQPGKP